LRTADCGLFQNPFVQYSGFQPLPNQPQHARITDPSLHQLHQQLMVDGVEVEGKPVGKSLAEHDLVGTARDIMAKATEHRREIVLPVDAVVAHEFAARAPSRVVAVDAVDGDDMILDIGPRSIEHVVSVLARTKTLVWNGPFGAFELEPFDTGTVEAAEAAAELSEAGKLVSVAGGGDTVAALNKAGVADRFTYVSTAGGAFLEWLEGKALPGVEVLRVK
jgi:phosphoglycerate kinase